jgi:hypothetical protein
MTDSKKVVLYLDDTSLVGKEVVDYLTRHKIKFTVASSKEIDVPLLVNGPLNYEGFEEIKFFVEGPKMKVIIVEKRGEDYYCAMIYEGPQPEHRGLGATSQEAIGNLVYSRKESFGISSIQYPALEYGRGKLVSSNSTKGQKSDVSMPVDCGQVFLHADAETPDGKQAVEYLTKCGIEFDVMPEKCQLPFLVCGGARYSRYVGYEQIKFFVEGSKMKVVISKKHAKDYYGAFVEDSSEIVGFGATIQVAIGNLVYSRQAVFGVSGIKYPQLKNESQRRAVHQSKAERR